MEIKVSKSELRGEIYIPGSKSHTVRAIAAALVAKGISKMKNPLVADDTLSCLHAAEKLGENARKNMIERRNWLNIVKIYQEVYDYASKHR